MHRIDDWKEILTHNEWPSFLYDLELVDLTGDDDRMGFLMGYFLVRVCYICIIA